MRTRDARTALVALLAKELREQALVSAVVFVLLVATAALVVFSYPILKSMPELENISRTAPELKQFGDLAAQISRMLGDYSYYLWSQWFPKNLVQIAAIFAIIVGVMAFGSEYAARTFEYLLTRPVRRRDVFVVKVAARLIALAAVVFGSSAVYYALGFAGNARAMRSVDALGFVAAAAGVWLMCALSLAIAVALAVRVRKTVTALVASVGAVLALSTASQLLERKLPEAFRLNERLLGPAVYSDASLNGATAAVVIAASLALFALAWRSFERQDV